MKLTVKPHKIYDRKFTVFGKIEIEQKGAKM